jgi:hypothetical protein
VTTFEFIRAYNTLCVTQSTNYLVYSKALMQRANNEVDRSKTFERSLAQSQQLIDQYRDDKDCLPLEKLNYSFST